MLRLDNRRDAQLEFFNGFDSVLLLRESAFKHFRIFSRNLEPDFAHYIHEPQTPKQAAGGNSRRLFLCLDGFTPANILDVKARSLDLFYEARKSGVKQSREIIADNLKKAGWSLGWISAVDSEGRTTWIVDAYRDGERFVVRADEKLTACRIGIGVASGRIFRPMGHNYGRHNMRKRTVRRKKTERLALAKKNKKKTAK